MANKIPSIWYCTVPQKHSPVSTELTPVSIFSANVEGILSGPIIGRGIGFFKVIEIEARGQDYRSVPIVEIRLMKDVSCS
jgi:hypothetical protein